MDKQVNEFYERLWRESASGMRCVTTLTSSTDKAGKPITIPRNFFFATNAEAIAKGAELDQPGVNVYHGCSLYSSAENRTAANTCGAYAIWMDVDFKDFPAPGIAMAELKRFLSSLTGIVPTSVDSGGGRHCYWFTTDAISTAEIKEYGGKINAIAKVLGFKLDASCTADAARILRQPGTRNHKYDPPRLVSIKRLGDPVPKAQLFADIDAAFAKYCGDEVALPAGKPARTVAALNGDLSAGIESNKRITTPEALAELLPFIKPEPGEDDISHKDWLAVVFGAIEDVGPDAVPVLREHFEKGAKYNAENFKATVKLALGNRGNAVNKGLGRAIDLARAGGWKPATPANTNGETTKTAGTYIRADTGNAARFVDVNGHRLRVLAGGVWLAWTGSRWKQDSAIAMQCAVALARDMLDEAVKIDEESARKAAVQHALATNSAGRLEAMLKIAATDPRLLVAGEQLDADELGLNTPTGYVDLKTGTVLPHDPTQLCTKITNAGPDWATATPVFDGFMSTLFDGDAALIEYALRLLGYILTGSTREQILAFLYGTGCNGKSTLVELLAYIMGDYAAPIDTSLLMESRTPAGGANPELLRLRGLRLAFATETGDGAAFAESRLKWLTGGDTLTARDLYAAPVSWKPSHKLLLSGNYRPAIRGQDHGIWRRIHLVPFTVQIEEAQRDPELPAKLRAEAPGILAKLIDACGRWMRDGLKTPAAVKGATAAYRDESDSIGEFLAECCECSPDAVVPVGQVYPSYRMWAARNGITPLGGRRFGALLDERGYPSDKGTGGARIRRGLRLRISALHL